MFENIIVLIIQVVIFFLPAGIANIAPVLVKNINFLNKPISDKLFGSHKTYRGFFFGILAALIIAYMGYLFLPLIPADYLIINYSSINLFFLGFLLGFGALLGDLVKSFFKRRFEIKPGASWILFDQLDYIAGAILFSGIYVSLPGKSYLVALVIFGLLHPIVNYAGYLLGLKKNKF